MQGCFLISLSIVAVSLFTWQLALRSIAYDHYMRLSPEQVTITSIDVAYKSSEDNTLCICTPKGVYHHQTCDVYVSSKQTCTTEQCGSIFAGNTYSLLTNEDDDD